MWERSKSLYSQLKYEKIAQEEFCKFVMDWVKHQDKRPVDEKSDPWVGTRGMDRLFSLGANVDLHHVRRGSLGFRSPALGDKEDQIARCDPQGWIKKAELYFKIYGITPQFRIRLAQLSNLHSRVQRFSGLELQNPYEQLATLHQVTSIHEYIEDFEYLLSLVPRLPESQAVGYFVASLQDEVKRWVHLHRPQTRLDAMYLAKDVEQLLRPSSMSISQSRSRYQNFSNGSGSTLRSYWKSFVGRPDGKGSGTTTTGLNDKGPISTFVPNLFDLLRSTSSSRSPSHSSSNSVSSGIRNPGFRSLSRTEWEDRRKKDDKVVEEDGEIRTLDVMDEVATIETDSVPTGSCSVLEFQGSLVTASPGGKTLKIEGSISGIPMVILVDSGASHNFVSQKLTTALGISLEFFSGINITLGDGHAVFVNQRCRDLSVVISGCDFLFDALLFEMGQLDLILGIEWLKTLGEVIHNWEKQTMRFQWKGTSVFIQGLSEAEVQQASLHLWLSMAEPCTLLSTASQIIQPEVELSVLSDFQQ
ncbi:hypothetical protein OSB04_024111 [Centaurea solstitialis]|uniref:Retrotransposon gag domain-containing protein n=1 Tax=Centaurea solstitialis TaxID=347529 RepID=A0AA38SM59_9ASTR|nr:hypothetical protein OSB04_024111 [Centaurea solstitialis]